MHRRVYTVRDSRSPRTRTGDLGRCDERTPRSSDRRPARRRRSPPGSRCNKNARPSMPVAISSIGYRPRLRQSALAFAPIGKQDQNGQRGAVVVQGCDDFALDVLAGSDAIDITD